MIKIMETSSRQNQDEIIESMLNFPDEPGSKRVRTKFDNIIVLLLDACSFTGLARYYPKLYNFLEATRRGEVLGYSGFRYFPGLSGVNSPPNKLRMFGNETDVKYIHKNHANKSHIWINEYARMHGYFVAHGGVEAKYQLGDAASWYTDAVDWTFNQSLYSNFSAACGIPPDHRDECKYMKMFGANTSLSEPGIKFDGGTGCNNYCYFGTSRHSLLLNTMTRLIQRKQGVFAFLELVEPHSLYRVVNQNFEEYVIEFLSSLMLSSRSSLIHVISDHGLHYTDYSKTEMGLLDHKVPFWYMIAPDNILKDCEQQKAYLTENEKKRVSWVDFYRTFIESHSLGECNSKAEARMGVPLHLDPVPRNRTCSQAGVPEHLCLLNLPLNPCDQQDMDLPNKIVEYMLKKNPEDQCIKPKPHQVGIDKYLCYYQSNAHAEILASVKLRDKSLTYQVSLGENMEINGIKPDFTYGNMVTQCRGKVKSLETCICEKGL